MTNNFSICFLVRRFPNGVQPYILNQTIAMENSGLNIQIIASKVGANINQLTRPKANPIYINTKLSNLLQHIISRSIFCKKYLIAAQILIKHHCWRKDEISDLLRKISFARIFCYQHFDIIHSHSLFSSSNYLFLQQYFSIPIVTTYHGVLPHDVSELEASRMLKLFNEGSLFLVNTQSAKNDLKKLGCPSEKIQITPQGIILDKFPYQKHMIHKNNKITLLSVGRLSPEKGHKTSIKAVTTLIKEFPNIKYHIIGDGPERKKLQELIQNLELTDIVTLHGFKNHDELIPFYSAADIFVLPSIEETQGIVLQEAQASGLPIIASRVGGIPEVIIENKTGLLFDKNNHSQLSEKIKILINNSELYSKISIKGRADVETRFDIKIICERLISTYKRFI